jgi:GH15 family glucan-1,4-alpha-glucosidase
VTADWNGVTRYRFGEGGADAAAAWLGPPFAPAPRRLTRHLQRAERALRAPNGGLRPGQRFTDPNISWTPETAMFALAYAASGRPAKARFLLGWLARHRTALGALPEKVSAAGAPASVAPLAWTDALVLLALEALERPLPTPPG